MGLRGPGAKKNKNGAGRPSLEEQAWKRALRDGNLSRAELVGRFVESLPITSGPLAGQKFRLREWQRRIVEGIYQTDANGKRIVREALLTIPRKNGKTGLTAALALAHLCGPESEQRGQVYSAAADRNQATLIYNEMRAIINAVPWLKKRIIIRDFNKHLEDIETGSTFQALSADAGTKHGFSASCVIYDELAQAPDRKLYDVLKTSTGARSEPLVIVISTQSGDPNHIMSELVDYGIQVRDGIIDAPWFYPCIYSAPEDADPWAEETWFGCNPALGDFRDLEEMRVAATDAQRMPAREMTFRLLYLNQRVAAEKRFVPRAEWDACAEEFAESGLEGLPCFGGLDLSGKNDLTALSLVFPREDGTTAALSYFWTPVEGLEEAQARDRVPYDLWVKQGELQTTPGRVIDYRTVALKIAELEKQFDIKAIAFDRWKINYLLRELEDIGCDIAIKETDQSFKGMDPAISALEDEILSGRLHHDGNPVQDWCIDNVRVTTDANGNRKFDKRKATGRIDGAVALAMACNMATNMAQESEPQFFVVGA